MTPAEREAFLADVHVGVLSVADGDDAPLTVPIWYAYEPGGAITVHTAADSRKTELLRAAGRATLVAQTEDLPYRYVSVRGPVVIEEADEAERAAMARRYLGDFADGYLEATAGIASVTVRLTPARWSTVDFGKGGV